MVRPLPTSPVDRALEQTILRRGTDFFIATGPQYVVLIPRVQVQTSSGGYEWTDGAPRAAQPFRLIEQTSLGDLSRGEGGVKERTATFTLLGQWDAVVKPYDHWEQDGQQLEVTFMLPYNGYEVRALVDSYGSQA